MTRHILKLILVRTFISSVAVLFFLVVASNTGDLPNKIESHAGSRVSESASIRKAYADLPKHSADLKFRYERRKNFLSSAPERTVLLSRQAVLEVAAELRKQIALPFEIQVVFVECGGPDSFYNEDSHRIVICYELIDAYDDLFSQTLKVSNVRDEATKGAIVSMFLHEVAHALIHAWDLPITGREEDAADQFSTLLLINSIPEGDQLALNTARSFKLLAGLEKVQEEDYSDPHSLDAQRFFNTICLVYGHRPERYEYLIRSGELLMERAYDCEENYIRANRSWQTLLAPHLVRPNPH